MRSSVTLTMVIAAVVLTVIAATLTYVKVRQIASESPVVLPPLPQFNDANPTAAPATPTPRPLAATGAAITPTEAATSAATSTVSGTASAAIPVNTDPTRVTILLMGIDQRKGETGEFNTDTMMVLSIDPTRKTAAMLSIPRDIYLKIPFYSVMRINRAYAVGDSEKFPGGGGALAIQTVEGLIGVPIQHYVLINFDVFTTAVDAIGPVQVCPQNAIHDNQYPDGSYGYITVDFPAGCQMLDSTKLLQYARVRHNAGDDFGRSARQQEVIRAVRDKVLSLGGVSALLGKAGDVWSSIKDNVKTDMTLTDMIQLAQLAQGIDKANIRSAVLTDTGQDSTLIPNTLPGPTGDQVLSPVYERIHDLVTVLFDAPPVTNSPASAENATVVVSNGTSVSGLANTTADKLRGAGFNVINTQNADNPNYAKTVIKLYADKMKTAQFLAQTLGLPDTAIVKATNGPTGVDIEVVAGKDLSGQ